VTYPTIELAKVAAPKGLVGGPFGSSLVNRDYTDTGIPVIRGTNMSQGKFVAGEFAYVSDEKAEGDLARNQARAGDLVFTQRGTLGQVAIVPAGVFDRYVVSQSQMRLRVNASVADADFVYYACTSATFLKQIDDHAIATGVPHINLGILGRLEVPMPSLYEQQRIAGVLAALDDKIAANRKLASTAESLLSARFAELSIDVDHGDQISLDSYFELNPKCSKPISDEPTYLDMQKLPASEILVSEWGRRPAKGGTRFTNGDVLLARITPCLENGKVGYVDFLDDGEVALGSTEYIVLRARSGVPRELAYFLAKSPRFRSTAIQHMVGTSGRQRLSAADVAGFTVRQVDSDVLEEWGRLSSPLVKHLGSLRNENRTLAAVRDTLLPRLMSGELRVRDAEKSVEAVL